MEQDPCSFCTRARWQGPAPIRCKKSTCRIANSGVWREGRRERDSAAGPGRGDGRRAGARRPRPPGVRAGPRQPSRTRGYARRVRAA
eukprot:5957057-Prymnesium_polylepis.1